MSVDNAGSQNGAGDAGSQGGSPKTYTEAELQEHVGRAQSALAKQLADHAKRLEEAETARSTQQQELEDYRKAAKEGTARVSDVARDKALAAREQAIAAKELEVVRRETATELGKTVEDLAGFTLEQLSTAKLMKKLFSGDAPSSDGGGKQQQKSVTPNRGSGTGSGGGTSSVSSGTITAQAQESLRFIRTHKGKEE